MNSDLLESLTWNEKVSTLASYLLVGGMMACFLSLMGLLGQAIDPDWLGWYFGPLAFIISLESLYVYQRRRQLRFPEAEWFSFFTAEWGIIILGLRVLIYLKQGLSQLWIDLSRGVGGFLESFFSGEFIAALVGVILVWILTNWFADLMAPLRNDATLVILEGGADTSVERHAVRQQLANLVLLIGIFMALLTAGLRSESFTTWARLPLMRIGVFNVMLYFVLALLLLSQTQFALLRARWGLNRFRVSRRIGASWILYTLIFLMLVGLFSLALPTSYTFGLLSLLNYLLGLVLLAGGFVVWLLSIPIFYVSLLLSSLFGMTPLERIPPPRVITPPVEETTAQAMPIWLELARSIFFWGVLVSLLAFALVVFLRSRREDILRLGKIPLFRWLKDIILLFRQSVHSAGNQLNQLAAQGMALFRRSGRGSRDAPWTFVNVRRLTARAKVRFYYQAMLRRAGETGRARKSNQTPSEFAQLMDEHIRRETQTTPEHKGLVAVEQAGEALRQLTAVFIQARYSPQEVSDSDAASARGAWDVLRRLMQSWKRGDQ